MRGLAHQIGNHPMVLPLLDVVDSECGNLPGPSRFGESFSPNATSRQSPFKPAASELTTTTETVEGPRNASR
jgi:hypothetical protein